MSEMPGIGVKKVQNKLKAGVQSATFTIRLAHTLNNVGNVAEVAAADRFVENKSKHLMPDKVFEDSVGEKAESGITAEQGIGSPPPLGASEDQDANMSQDRATQMLTLWGLPSSESEAKRLCAMMQKIGQQDAFNTLSAERRHMLEDYKVMLENAKEKGSFEETEAILQSISKITGKDSQEIDSQEKTKNSPKLQTLYSKPTEPAIPKSAKDIAKALGLPYDLKDYKLDPRSTQSKFSKALRRHSQQLRIMSAASGKRPNKMVDLMSHSLMSNLEAATSQGLSEEEVQEKQVYMKRKQLLQDLTGLGVGAAAEELAWGDASKGLIHIPVPLGNTINLAMKLKRRANRAKLKLKEKNDLHKTASAMKHAERFSRLPALTPKSNSSLWSPLHQPIDRVQTKNQYQPIYTAPKYDQLLSVALPTPHAVRPLSSRPSSRSRPRRTVVPRKEPKFANTKVQNRPKADAFISMAKRKLACTI